MCVFYRLSNGQYSEEFFDMMPQAIFYYRTSRHRLGVTKNVVIIIIFFLPKRFIILNYNAQTNFMYLFTKVLASEAKLGKVCISTFSPNPLELKKYMCSYFQHLLDHNQSCVHLILFFNVWDSLPVVCGDCLCE